MAKRKMPKASSLNRRQPHRLPRLKLVVICEGEKTEPIYLKDFIRDHQSPLVEVKIIPKGGVPVTLVNNAMKFKEMLARETRNSFDHFQIWGLLDVDEHPNLSQAKQKAKDNEIELGISNPCFELWGLLHFCQYDAPIHRHALQRLLEEQMSGYRHDAAATFNYIEIRDKYDLAKKHAEQGCRRREEEGDPGGNPSTNVYKLLDLIIENAKIMKARGL
jgi:hypothetical protein